MKKVFKSVSLDFVTGKFATIHRHSHEQSNVISSECRLKVKMLERDTDVLLHAGDSYAIPG